MEEKLSERDILSIDAKMYRENQNNVHLNLLRLIGSQCSDLR